MHGVVQGVGYRSFVASAALRHGITGFVKNLPEGSVEILAQGNTASLKDFEDEILHYELGGAEISEVEKSTGNPDVVGVGKTYDKFVIEH
ncbi:MAG: acylphosphatase [Candidatus Micrarchaeaceae archaeon]